MRHAGNLIVGTLSDQALRIVRSVIGDPSEMLSKLDRRYDSNSTASKIVKMSELVSTKYTSLREDMAKLVDRMTALVEQLRSMGTVFDESLAIDILVVSIDVFDLQLVTAAMKTLADADITWEEVSNRLIEEAKHRSSYSASSARDSAANSACQICHKTSHRTDQCFLNPMSDNCRFKVSAETVEKILGGKPQRRRDDRRNNGNGKKWKPKKDDRYAMTRGQCKRNGRKIDRMMMDGGTTSHLTPHVERVHSKTPCEVVITLTDASTVRSSHKGVRKVSFATDAGPRKVSLSETIVVPDAGMSLLSVPSLVQKNIGLIFMPRRAVLFDLLDDMATLCYAEQDIDGLFYIGNDCESIPPSFSRADERQLSAMMAVVRRKFMTKPPTCVPDELNDDGDCSLENSEEDEIDSDSPTVLTRDDNISKGNKPPKARDEIVKTWYLRLGHDLPLKAVARHVTDVLLPHVSCTSVDCDICLKGEFKRRFAGSLTSSMEPDTLQFDTKGKIETESGHGHHYFVTIVEEHSRFVATRPIRSKADASHAILAYV